MSDNSYFRNTAKQTRKINIAPSVPRGGIKL